MLPLGSPSLARAIFHLRSDWTITKASHCAARVFGGDCEDDMIGRNLWTLAPGMETSPLGAACHQAMQTRQTRAVSARSVVRPTQRVLARIQPTPDGGLRLAFRFINARQPSRTAALVRFAASSAAPLLLGLKMFHLGG